MRTSGISRRVDDLGRIVLPIEMRRQLDIKEKDVLEIAVEDETIVLKKHETFCIFCGSDRNNFDFRGKVVCSSCAEAMSADR